MIRFDFDYGLSVLNISTRLPNLLYHYSQGSPNVSTQMIENFQGAPTARLCSAMFENTTLTRADTWKHSRGGRKTNFHHATQNGVQTPSLLSQKHQLEKHFITVIL